MLIERVSSLKNVPLSKITSRGIFIIGLNQKTFGVGGIRDL